jgi:hypothetical protein
MEYSIPVMLGVNRAAFLFVQQEFHRKVDCVDYQHWKEPKLIVKILLHFFCHHPNNIDLLFQLLRALCEGFIPDFQVCHVHSLGAVLNFVLTVFTAKHVEANK